MFVSCLVSGRTWSLSRSLPTSWQSMRVCWQSWTMFLLALNQTGMSWGSMSTLFCLSCVPLRWVRL